MTMEIEKMDGQKIILNNGSRLIVAELPGSPSVTFSVITKSGPFFDPVGKPGLSHFLEHLIFKGTKRYPDIDLITEILEKNGVVTGAFSYQYEFRTNTSFLKQFVA